MQLLIGQFVIFEQVDAHYIIEQTRAEQQSAIRLDCVCDVASCHPVTRIVQRAHYSSVGVQLHHIRRREVKR